MLLDTETGLYRLYWSLCFSNSDAVTFRVDFLYLHTLENTIRDQPGSEKNWQLRLTCKTTDTSMSGICTKRGTSRSHFMLISRVSPQEVEGTVVSLLQAPRVPNDRPQFGSVARFLEVSVATKVDIFSSRPGDISSCSCGDQNKYFKPNPDVFLTLTSVFFCVCVCVSYTKQTEAQRCHEKEM